MAKSAAGFSCELYPRDINKSSPMDMVGYERRTYDKGMTTDRRKLTESEMAECAALKAEVAAFNSSKANKRDRLTQESLAQELGMTQGNLSSHLNGKRPISKEIAAKVALLLGISVERISARLAREIEIMARTIVPKKEHSVLYGGVAPLVGDNQNVSILMDSGRPPRKYPLISWVAAGSWQESCDTFHPGDADEWIESSEHAGVNGYWLEVKGPSMQPHFPEGSRILVKPEGFDLVSGRLYIARLRDSGETTFKQYLRDSGNGYLQPYNPAFPIMPITDSVEIIGEVIDGKMHRSLFR